MPYETFPPGASFTNDDQELDPRSDRVRMIEAGLIPDPMAVAAEYAAFAREAADPRVHIYAAAIDQLANELRRERTDYWNLQGALDKAHTSNRRMRRLLTHLRTAGIMEQVQDQSVLDEMYDYALEEL